MVEAQAHPHVPEERADFFRTFDGGSTELEYLNLLTALVMAAKPDLVLETGTGRGFGTIAIAMGLKENGIGRAITVEHNDGVSKDAEQRLETLCPSVRPLVSYVVGQTLEFLRDYEGRPFDFAFLDSDVLVRHRELGLLQERRLLNEGALCCVHDTSRLRSRTSGDSNEAMIDALDKASTGREWLEFPLSRGFRILRPGPSLPHQGDRRVDSFSRVS